MKDEDFDLLLQSAKEAVEISQGKRKPALSFHYDIKPSEVAVIRAKTNKSQTEFAHMIGISVSTLRNWEQGGRTPTGPAKILLKIVDDNPNYVEKIVQKIPAYSLA